MNKFRGKKKKKRKMDYVIVVSKKMVAKCLHLTTGVTTHLTTDLCFDKIRVLQ